MSDCVKLLSSYEPLDYIKVQFHHCLGGWNFPVPKTFSFDGIIGACKAVPCKAFLVDLMGLFQNSHSRLGYTLSPQMVCPR